MLIFNREFRRNLKILIIWSVIISGLMILTLSAFPEVVKQQKAIDQIIKGMPTALIKAFDMDVLNISDALGYYATKGYIMITLFGAIYAVMLGGNILSKEHSEKTIEFLLSKPVLRSNVITQKLLAVFVNVMLFNLIVAAANYIGFKSVDATIDFKVFASLTAAPLMLHLLFAAISFFLSSSLKKSRNAMPISLGLVFVMYFLYIVAGIADKYAKIKYVSPFEYVNAADIIINKGLDTIYMSIMVGVIIISIFATYIVYRKKDITI